MTLFHVAIRVYSFAHPVRLVEVPPVGPCPASSDMSDESSVPRALFGVLAGIGSLLLVHISETLCSTRWQGTEPWVPRALMMKLEDKAGPRATPPLVLRCQTIYPLHNPLSRLPGPPSSHFALQVRHGDLLARMCATRHLHVLIIFCPRWVESDLCVPGDTHTSPLGVLSPWQIGK